MDDPIAMMQVVCFALVASICGLMCVSLIEYLQNKK